MAVSLVKSPVSGKRNCECANWGVIGVDPFQWSLVRARRPQGKLERLGANAE